MYRTLFALLVAAQVGLLVFIAWEPPFDGSMDYGATLERVDAYWPMNVLLGGPSFAVCFLAAALLLARIGGRLTAAGALLLALGGLVFSLVVTAEVLPFVWAADPGVLDPATGREVFAAFDGELAAYVAYVLGSMAAVALGVLLAVVGAWRAGGLPGWVVLAVVVVLVATLAVPAGSVPAMVVFVVERGMWVLLGWYGLRHDLACSAGALEDRVGGSGRSVGARGPVGGR